MIFPIVDVLARIGAGKTFLVSGMLRVSATGRSRWSIRAPNTRLAGSIQRKLRSSAAGVELTGSILFMLGWLDAPGLQQVTN